MVTDTLDIIETADARGVARQVAVLLRSERLADAETLLWGALDRHPGTVDLSASLARLLLKKGDVARSVELWTKVMEHGVALPAAWYTSAISAFLTAGAKADAAAVVAKGLAAHPNDRALHRVAASEARRSNDIDAAIQHLEFLLKSGEPDSRTIPELASLLVRKGNYDRAVELWDQVGGPDAFMASLRILIDSGELEKAEARLNTLPAVKRSKVSILTEEARLLHRQGKLRKSAEVWTQVAHAEDSSKPYSQAASLLRILGDAVEAERLIGRAMEISSRREPAHFRESSMGQAPAAARPKARKEKPTSVKSSHKRRGQVAHGTDEGIDLAIEKEKASGRSGILQYPSELRFLAQFLKENHVESFFEVGMRHGELALFLRNALKLKRIGGSELFLKERLGKNIKDHDLDVFVGDHNTQDYLRWRSQRGRFDFIFIDGDHSYSGISRDFSRERQFMPRFIGFHDVWNIAALGCKKFWDEQRGKVAEYCNLDPEELMFVTARPNQKKTFIDHQRELAGYCAGIGIVSVRA